MRPRSTRESASQLSSFPTTELFRMGPADSRDRYEPETKKYGVDSYPNERYITNIALRQNEPGVRPYESYSLSSDLGFSRICKQVD